MDLKPFLKKDYIKQGTYSKSRGVMEFPSGRYDVGFELGGGSWGDVLFVSNQVTNTVSAVKVLDIEKYQKPFDEFIRLGIIQALINIILEEESKDQPEGPYVPEFYEIAFDPERNYILLRHERINETIYSRYTTSTIEENDKIIPRTVAHLAHILEFFNERLQFNHRDLTVQNVMYNYLPSGEIDIKIIDFGFCCLNYYGTEIKGSEYFKDKFTCNLLSRDLNFFLYQIYSSRSIPKSEKLLGVLEFLLTFPIQKKTCRLYENNCYAYNLKATDFYSIYDFLNYEKIHNPKTTPAYTRQFMMDLLGIQTSKKVSPIHSILDKKIPGLPYCPVFKILNPKTRRCVNRDSNIGRYLLKQSKRYKLPHISEKSKTRRAMKPCKPHQTRNPFTHRCHKRYVSTPFTPDTRLN